MKQEFAVAVRAVLAALRESPRARTAASQLPAAQRREARRASRPPIEAGSRSWLTLRRSYRLAPVLVVLSPLMMGVDDQGCISSHPPDAIVTKSPQDVTVTLTTPDGQRVDGEVELFVGAENQEGGQSQGTRTTQNGAATFPGVPLSHGTQRLSASTRRVVNGEQVNGTIKPQLIHLHEELKPAGRQEVMFNWKPIAEQRIRDIASNTLTLPATLSDAQRKALLDQFVTDVKARARQFFTTLYQPYDVVLVDQPTPANGGVVSVNFEDTAPLLGGPLGTNIASVNPRDIALGIPDFNNLRKTQTVRVLVGTLKTFLVDDGRLFGESAARPSDSLEDRVKDIGIALGRLAVHEVGHTLGLVSDPNIIKDVAAMFAGLVTEQQLNTIAKSAGIQLPLPDMDGCRQGHSCPEFDAAHPLADRFADGYYIMDPGEVMITPALLGLSRSLDERKEQLPTFDVFCATYLAAVHPKP